MSISSNYSMPRIGQSRILTAIRKWPGLDNYSLKCSTIILNAIGAPEG